MFFFLSKKYECMAQGKQQLKNPRMKIVATQTNFDFMGSADIVKQSYIFHNSFNKEYA